MKRVLAVYRHRREAEPYAAALRQANMDPVLALPGEAASLTDVAGLLLTGGEDVNPALYGEPAHPLTEAPDDERDAVEIRLIREALAQDLPLFGICRGLQILNVEQGGTLIQHVEDTGRHQVRSKDKSRVAHAVDILPGTLLSRIAQRHEGWVNSRHHQAIARVGEGLRVSARDPIDNLVEAIEIPSRRFALAVQWHPENQSPVDREQARLFEAFAEAL